MSDRQDHSVQQETRQSSSVIAVMIVVGMAAGVFAIWKIWVLSHHLSPHDDDVSNNPTERNGIVPGFTYLLSMDLYVEKVPGGGLWLDEPRAGEEGIPAGTPAASPAKHPKSRIQYEANPANWPNIIGFLGPEATILVEKVYRHYFTEDVHIYVTGTVTDGEKVYKGVKWWQPKVGSPLR